ncbi:MAG: adenylyl-sulfate kinase [Bacillota bacterium]|nr:adenylyl-sulfate kinase [Bacillota bacterium]
MKKDMQNTPQEEMMNVVMVGHVDHGKSTVIGRLLADTDSLPEGKLDLVRENCKRNSKPFEYAFLLDALKNEQAQGITIDTARCFFKTKKRRYILIDAPGHIEFLKNMVTGASRAEAAMLVIDAARGVEENTRRHGYFLSMLGIHQVVVLVNKMDLVEYKQSVFEDISRQYAEFLRKIEIQPQAFIPVSGYAGDNIACPSERMPWFSGMTLLEQLDEFQNALPADKQPLRLPVQGVYKFTENNDSRRIIAGTVEAGTLKMGDEIVFYPSGKRTSVKSLERFNDSCDRPFCSQEAAAFTMTNQIYVKRGEIACRVEELAPHVGVRLRVNLFWLGKSRLDKNRNYFFKCGTAKVSMQLEAVERVVNASDLSCLSRQYVEKNEVAECIFLLDSPVAFDLAGSCEASSRFVIVDNYEIAGGGIITEALEAEDFDKRNIRWAAGSVGIEERKKLNKHKGLIVWMTGLSGAGKSSIAEDVERQLVSAGIHTYVLDGDKLRHGLNSDLGFSQREREENVRRTAELASILEDAGLVTIVTLISPFAEGRAFARSRSRQSFVEVYVKARLETCIKRDPKQLYRKALEGKISDFTGISSAYEAPTEPDLVLDTDIWTEEECVEVLFNNIMSRVAE